MGTETFTPGLRFDRYEIVAPLGEGGMGTVWKARHLGLKKLVVVKVLKGERAHDEQARRRFLREGEAASRVRHPHVVEVFDVGEHAGAPYLVMEFLEGSDLRRHLAQRGPLATEDLCDIMVPVCSAVHAAHTAGVIHRDLKPDNIFLARSRDGGRVTPKVLDFGISRIEDDAGNLQTATSALLGTPPYMAPELARGAKLVNARSDQYALGVVLYLGATGRLPIDEPDVYEHLRRVVHGEYEPPARVRPDLPPAFEAVILRAMALDPKARFDSARALGAALLPFTGERVRAVFADDLSARTSTLDDLAAPTAASDERAGESNATSNTITDSVVAVPPNIQRRRARNGLVALLASAGLAASANVAWLASRPAGRATVAPPAAATPRATAPRPAPPALAPPVADPPSHAVAPAESAAQAPPARVARVAVVTASGARPAARDRLAGDLAFRDAAAPIAPQAPVAAPLAPPVPTTRGGLVVD